MEGGGGAFIKGGCGCLVAFAVVALLAVMVGGHAHIDLGGALCLFVMGGLFGLVFFAVYNKGRDDATAPESRSARSAERFGDIEPRDEETSFGPAEPIRCLECGQIMSPETAQCPKCGWSWKASGR
ncbi:MAG: hypothetical protein WD066_13685 [Planctomycetaceae bacterium]